WDEQVAKLEARGLAACFFWSDILTDLEANAAATRLYAEGGRRIGNDPQPAEDFFPHYPFGCKRVTIDVGYFETFNRDNVRLVNLRKNPIQAVTANGIQLQDELLEVD